MRIALVTTWGQACGISTYSEELAAQLRQHCEILVLAPNEGGAGVRETGIDVPWQLVWHRQSVSLGDELLGFLDNTNTSVDLVHFQHEDGLFHNPQSFLAACTLLRKRGVKIVVTPHTIRSYGMWAGSGWSEALCEVADAVVCHTPEGLAALACAKGGRGAELTLIPHGAAAGSVVGDRTRGLDFLRLPASVKGAALEEKITVAGVFGFVGPNKNLICTVRAFSDAIARGLARKSVLVIVGQAADEVFFGPLVGAVREAGYLSRVFLFPEFTPVNMVPHVMAAFDFGVLNTTSWVLSASGSSHIYARQGVPLAVANRPIYSDAVRGGAIPFDLNPTDESVPTLAAVNAIGGLAACECLRREVGESMRRFSEQVRWEKAAEQHVGLYKRLLEVKSG